MERISRLQVIKKRQYKTQRPEFSKSRKFHLVVQQMSLMKLEKFRSQVLIHYTA